MRIDIDQLVQVDGDPPPWEPSEHGLSPFRALYAQTRQVCHLRHGQAKTAIRAPDEPTSRPASHVNVSWSIMMFLLSHEPPQRLLSLYWRSQARFPTGHPLWPARRGTCPVQVLEGTGDLWQLPASWPARPIDDVNRPSGMRAVQGDLAADQQRSRASLRRSGRPYLRRTSGLAVPAGKAGSRRTSAVAWAVSTALAASAMAIVRDMAQISPE